jgi:aminopeptidase N
MDSTTSGPWWSWHWKEDHTIANYLIVVAASNQFAVLSDTFNYSTYTMPLWHWVSQEDSLDMEYRFRNTPDMLYWFSETYGIYPFIDEKYGHVSADIGGAMEDQTNTFFNTDANWGSDWDWVVAHELAHQWWGDWVTCGTWKDIWLNEGFATFSEAHWYWYRDGEPAYHYYMKHHIMDYYKNYEPYPPYPCYDPDFLFSVVTYEKGASVLHMLRHIVGDSLYFELLRQYGTSYAEGSAVTAEFTSKAEEVTAMGLDWFFDEWVYMAGYPRYEYGWWVDTLAADSFRVNLHIEQVQSHNWNVPTFKMPIDIHVLEAGGDTTRTVVRDSLDWQEFDIYTDAAPTGLEFDPGNWILKTATEVPAGIIHDGKIRRDLLSVYPNPCSRTMWISFVPTDRKPYTIHVFDVTGREITVFAGGTTATTWNLRDRNGERIANGIYFVKCVRGNQTLASGKAIVF